MEEHWDIFKKLKRKDAKGVERAIQNNHRRALEDLKREFIKLP
jgi:DNA-binding GntR family transcriptional regulator